VNRSWGLPAGEGATFEAAVAEIGEEEFLVVLGGAGGEDEEVLGERRFRAQGVLMGV
jgi:hypothetical protein